MPGKTLTRLRAATYDRGKRKGASLATADSLTSGVFELIWNAGPVAKFVLGVLLLFSVVSWALIVEKWWQLRRVRRQTLGFLKVFREGRRPSVVAVAAKKFRESPLAQLYFAAYQELAGSHDLEHFA